MKRILFQLLFAMVVCPAMANSLLQNPVTGSLAGLDFQKICMASNGTDVVLLLTDNNDIYAIDIADNAANEAGANTITSIPNFISGKLTPATGQTVYSRDLAVNPISKAVYVLVSNSTFTSSMLFKVKGNGATVSLVDLSNVSYSKISWGGSAFIMDMAWGNGTFYASSGGGLSSLDGELGWVKPPFVHNSTITKRATSMYKSNWGNLYLTDAPLETITLGNIAGKNRLMGVTTCAPGFSLDVANITASGVMQVTEDFNVNYGMSYKAIFQSHDGGNWLFDLHEAMGGRELYRIGEKYINGSQVSANKYNATAVELRDINMVRTAGLTDTDLKLFPGNYDAIAYWDNYRLLVLETAGALKMMQTAVSAPPLAIGNALTATNSITIYPNPSKGIFTIALPAGIEKGAVSVYDVTGKKVWDKYIDHPTGTLKMDELGKGNYMLAVVAADGSKWFTKFTME